MPKVDPHQSPYSHFLRDAKLYQLLVKSIEDYAIFMLDTSGHVVSWNKGAQSLKGYTHDEIVGQHFSIFYTAEDIAIDKPLYELKKAVRKGRVEDEFWRVRKDGTQFWANVVITALFDESGNHVGFAKITRDLTQRKRHEDALQEANDLLTMQRQELEALNSAKDEFIAIASHQLRTPATGVKQLLGLLIEGYVGDMSERQAEFLQRAYDTNTRQIDLVNDLLRVAQIDAGKVVLRKKPTMINELLLEIGDEISAALEDRDQTLHFHVNKTHRLHVAIDTLRIRMALENLIDNASKYTPRGGAIDVTTVVRDASVEIAVHDTGVGIPAEGIDKLFTKFSRIPNELSSSVNGSGLGLYWVKKIIELHDGTIDVASVLHEGSTFTVSLPRGESL